MTLKELEAYKKIHERINSLEERILRLRSQAERLTQVLRLSTGGTQEKDKLAAYVARLQELELQRATEVIAMEQDLKNLDSWLVSLPQQQERIMRLRYERGLPWREITKITHFSKRHCYRIHDAALKRCL